MELLRASPCRVNIGLCAPANKQKQRTFYFVEKEDYTMSLDARMKALIGVGAAIASNCEG